MAISLSRPLIALGAILLAHACYSAYEHSALHLTAGLPPDISIETILSVVFICIGLVIGAEELKPISWRVWAGKAERESRGSGPFQGLEDRLGFVDIRGQRKEFADWVRDQGSDNNG